MIEFEMKGHGVKITEYSHEYCDVQIINKEGELESAFDVEREEVKGLIDIYNSIVRINNANPSIILVKEDNKHLEGEVKKTDAYVKRVLKGEK